MSKQPPARETFDETREKVHRAMMSAVSHDLKTPLATIIGSLEIYTRMADKLSAEKKTILMKSALSEAYRLDQFITNILDMAKLESGMVQPTLTPCDLNSIIQDCIKKLGPRGAQYRIELETEHPPFTFLCDAVFLGRAIGLILDNATKHAGKNPLIHIAYGRRPDGIWIHVRDDGPGFPAGSEETIFSKYTRMGRSDQQQAGTGLGLAICRQLMQLLGGSVTASIHPEGGALFTLHYPTNL